MKDNPLSSISLSKSQVDDIKKVIFGILELNGKPRPKGPGEIYKAMSEMLFRTPKHFQNTVFSKVPIIYKETFLLLIEVFHDAIDDNKSGLNQQRLSRIKKTGENLIKSVKRSTGEIVSDVPKNIQTILHNSYWFIYYKKTYGEFVVRFLVSFTEFNDSQIGVTIKESIDGPSIPATAKYETEFNQLKIEIILNKSEYYFFIINIDHQIIDIDIAFGSMTKKVQDKTFETFTILTHKLTGREPLKEIAEKEAKNLAETFLTLYDESLSPGIKKFFESGSTHVTSFYSEIYTLKAFEEKSAMSSNQAKKHILSGRYEGYYLDGTSLATFIKPKADFYFDITFNYGLQCNYSPEKLIEGKPKPPSIVYSGTPYLTREFNRISCFITDTSIPKHSKFLILETKFESPFDFLWGIESCDATLKCRPILLIRSEILGEGQEREEIYKAIFKLVKGRYSFEIESPFKKDDITTFKQLMDSSKKSKSWFS